MKYRTKSATGLAISSAIVLFLATASTPAADDNRATSSWRKNRPAGETGPQLAFGLALRLGEQDHLDRTASMAADILYFAVPGVGVRLGGEYNHYTALKDTRVTIFGWELGARLQAPPGLLSPFLETGLDWRQYRGKLGGISATRTKVGWHFAAGLSVGLGRNGAIDLTFRKVLNHRRVDYAILDGSPILPPDDQSFEWIFFCGMGYSAQDKLYNPATFEVRYRFRL
jgi:hypothetical protein